MTLPVTRNINVYEGDTFRLKFQLLNRDTQGNPTTPVDLTGSLVKSQIRANDITTDVMAEFSATHDDAGGTVTLELLPSQTSALSNGLWDCQVEYGDGTVRTYLRGTVTVGQEITRV